MTAELQIRQDGACAERGRRRILPKKLHIPKTLPTFTASSNYFLNGKQMKTAGITIERNTRGEPTFARIDLKRHGDKLKDFFASNHIELEESPYDPEFVAKIRRAEKQESKTVDLKKYGISI
jgi:hypothetical protein